MDKRQIFNFYYNLAKEGERELEEITKQTESFKKSSQ